jgi:CheY-like chemotaxis protein
MLIPRPLQGLMQVLIVDDHYGFRAATASWLSMLAGIVRVISAASAQEALKTLETVRPDVVITDVRMPGMDGYELTRRIKAQPEAPVVILITSLAAHNFHDESGRAGADYAVEKHHLLDKLPEFLQQRFGLGGKPA